MRNIYIVGFMCSGKSTVGKILADRLSLSFVDVDEEIEKQYKKKIKDIFKEKGESFFRELERKKIEEISNRKNLVVSTGGGLGANLGNMNLMKKTGIVIWLKVPFAEIIKRCGKDTERPLLQLPEDKLKNLFIEREDIYRLADITIDTHGKKPEDIVSEILFLLKLIEK